MSAEQVLMSLGGTQNKAWLKNADKSFGFKMMKQMGWKEGEGLGKDGTGTTTHIRAAVRQENLGLGNFEGDLANAGFLTTIAGFDDVLKNLSNAYQSTVKKTLDVEKKSKKHGHHHHKNNKEEENKEKPCVVRHKYSRFLRNKNVQGYSEEDKNVIFGKVNVGDLTPMSDDMFGMKGLYSPVSNDEEKEKKEKKHHHKEKKEKKHHHKDKKHEE
ncbi:hypothetical protein WA158_003245 [Blastocystis sp. Blastoise]